MHCFFLCAFAPLREKKEFPAKPQRRKEEAKNFGRSRLLRTRFTPANFGSKDRPPGKNKD
jgi:hypothetical protein